MATRRPPVAWAALDGSIHAAPLSGSRKAAAAVAHGVAHLLLLVADARKPPGDRAAQGIRRKHRAHGAIAATGEIEKGL